MQFYYYLAEKETLLKNPFKLI